ncbi:MAG: zf-HC2 domain-containing protein, partial [Deltaproteobacteria bacterium]|nr:zf-HC2 domain-containing protein [Deltaproteobacteria bacterium]
MECAKIKSLLSEYMDKTLENDTAKEVKGHLLSCRECSNDYFLMKTIAQEMRSMERFKAPSNLLNRINLAVQKRPWYLRLPDFIPGSGGFRLPMEYLTLGATAILLFLIITGLYMDKPGAMRVAYNNSTFSDSGSTVSAPVELEFIPVRVKGSDTVSLDNLFSVSSGKALRNSELSDITEMMRLE